MIVNGILSIPGGDPLKGELDLPEVMLHPNGLVQALTEEGELWRIEFMVFQYQSASTNVYLDLVGDYQGDKDSGRSGYTEEGIDRIVAALEHLGFRR